MKESTLLKKVSGYYPNLNFSQILGPNWETVNNFWFVTENASYDKKLNVKTNRSQVIIDEEYLHYLTVSCYHVAPLFNNSLFVFGYGCGSFPIKEIIAMHRIIEDGRHFQYLPLFDCLYDVM